MSENLDDVMLLIGRGCDPAMLCDRPGRHDVGVTLADVREELHRRLGGRALREALTRVDESEAAENVWAQADAIRRMR